MSVRVAVKFCVGSSAIATAELRRSTTRSEALECALSMLRREGVPVPLELPVLRCVDRVCELGDAADAAAAWRLARSGDAAQCAQGARAWAAAFRAECAAWAGDSGNGGGDKNAAATAAQRQRRQRAMLFHDAVAESDALLDALLGIEDAFAVGLGVLRDGRRFALTKAHERQAAEMDAAVVRSGSSSSSSSNVAAPSAATAAAGLGDGDAGTRLAMLVAQHVAELEALERSWDVKEAAAIAQQTADFWDSVAELAAAPSSRATVVPQQAAPTAPLPTVALPSLTPSPQPVTGVRSLTQRLFGTSPKRPASAAPASQTPQSLQQPTTPPPPTPSPRPQQQQSESPSLFAKRVSLSMLIGQGQLKVYIYMYIHIVSPSTIHFFLCTYTHMD